MDAITELFKQDFPSIILGIFIIMSGIIAVYEIVCRFFSIFGKPIGVMKQRKADHELLLKTVKDLTELHNKHEEDTKQSIRHDRMIKEDLEKLTLIIQDKNINDWRYEILDMASAISSGRRYSKEQYDHVIDIHGRYENLLKSLGRTNGQVDASMEVIMESYKEKLKNGF